MQALWFWLCSLLMVIVVVVIGTLVMHAVLRGFVVR